MFFDSRDLVLRFQGLRTDIDYFLQHTDKIDQYERELLADVGESLYNVIRELRAYWNEKEMTGKGDYFLEEEKVKEFCDLSDKTKEELEQLLVKAQTLKEEEVINADKNRNYRLRDLSEESKLWNQTYERLIRLKEESKDRSGTPEAQALSVQIEREILDLRMGIEKSNSEIRNRRRLIQFEFRLAKYYAHKRYERRCGQIREILAEKKEGC